MRSIEIGVNNIKTPVIVQGCMRFANLSIEEVERLVLTQVENGVNFFDHADIYGRGKCEELFGEVLQRNPGLREKVIIQTKCGIRPVDGMAYYDSSKEHIINSVDEALKRLKTDYIDYLLIHRPDTLVDPIEVAEAFDELHKSGKVLHFGVSNQSPMQMELLKKYVKQPLEINQLQLSIMHTGMIDSGFNVNTKFEAGIDYDGAILDYCRLNDITIQCWSPFQFGMFEGVFLDNPKFPELNNKINEIAQKYNVSNTTIAVAWLLRHPANMQVIVGSTNLSRLEQINEATNIMLTRKEWYEIYLSAGNKLP